MSYGSTTSTNVDLIAVSLYAQISHARNAAVLTAILIEIYKTLAFARRGFVCKLWACCAQQGCSAMQDGVCRATQLMYRQMPRAASPHTETVTCISHSDRSHLVPSYISSAALSDILKLLSRRIPRPDVGPSLLSSPSAFDAVILPHSFLCIYRHPLVFSRASLVIYSYPSKP